MAGYVTVSERYHKDSKKNRSNIYIINGLDHKSGTKEISLGGVHFDPHKKIDETIKAYDSDNEQKNTGFALGSETDDCLNPSTEDPIQSPEKSSAGEVQLMLFEVYDTPKPQPEPKPEPKKPMPSSVKALMMPPKPAPEPFILERPVSRRETRRKAAKVRFEGILDIHKVLEIHTIYVRQGWLKRSMSDLLDFLCMCSRLNRLLQLKKVRDIYATLTFLVKNNKMTDGLLASDETKAQAMIHKLRNMGLIDL